MYIFTILIVIILFVLCFVSPKLIRVRRKSLKSRSDIRAWMEMSRDERHAIDEVDNKMLSQRKKKLLEQIRKEYSALSGKKKTKKDH